MRTIFKKEQKLLNEKQNFDGIIKAKRIIVVKLKLLIFLISFFVFVHGPTYAQPIDGSVTFASTATPGFVTGIFYVSLPDSTNCVAVEIHLEDQIEDSVLFSREYAFDQTAGLPPGISWSRNGNEVLMGIGTLPVRLGWQGKARLKNNSGDWSEYLEFIFQ